MTHVYSDTFFDYIDHGARLSAQALIAVLFDWTAPNSVVDLGCGRGVWLDEWKRAGADTILGVDGDYVNRATLAIPEHSFRADDLTRPLTLERRFDLAQSLEVGEHLPTEASDALVDSLTQASDRVLFSAAVVGQGGEFHINEQPLTFWQAKFASRGYRAYDCLRPRLRTNTLVEPWYRYNAVLYANAAGAQGLPEEVTATGLQPDETLDNGGDFKWRLRRGIVAQLPQGTVTGIARLRASVLASRARRKQAS
ncbi:MAG: methyltransferase domain-containing protein [Pseudomonadota bacterium]